MTAISLSYMLTSVTSVAAYNLVNKSMAKFYQVLACLFNSEFITRLNYVGVQLLKKLVNSVYGFFSEKKIAAEWTRIQEILNTQTPNISLASSVHNKDIFYYCVDSIHAFEQHLTRVSQSESELVREAKLIQDYATFITSLVLKCQRGTAKTVTQSLINESNIDSSFSSLEEAS